MSGRRYRARRRAELSQHFLRGRALAASIVADSSITGDDLVVEIGPGHGTLTRELLRRCDKLVTVEIDPILHRGLQESLGHRDDLSLVCWDFLQFELPSVQYKVVANIPFNKTAEIIRRLVSAQPPPTDAYLILQREAAEKYAGFPWAPESTSSLLLKPRWHIEIVRRFKKSDFQPTPTVDTVLLWLARRQRPLLDNGEVETYRDFLVAAFGRTGQTIEQCLDGIFTRSQITRLSSDLRFVLKSRPSDLSFEQWLGLFRFLRLAENRIAQRHVAGSQRIMRRGRRIRMLSDESPPDR